MAFGRVIRLVALLLAWSVTSGAQVVRVTLRDSASAEPVVGALVSALDSSGRTRADGLSNASGIVTLRMPFAGTWAITVRRIGVQPRTVPSVQVAEGASVALTVPLQNLRYRLATVRVSSDGVCGRRPDGGDRISVLWEQITLALRAAVLSRDAAHRSPAMRVVEFSRELTLGLDEKKSTVLSDGIGVGRPFSATDPDSLERYGYVRDEADTTRSYFAPDENVLLSESFMRTHCFTAPMVDDASMAELHFKPVRNRRLPDVEGTVFVDTVSGELRSIEFRYVAARNVIPRAAKHAGGSVALQRLSNGLWIVNAWAIRMPLFGRKERSYAISLIGYLERGGLVDPPDSLMPSTLPPVPPPPR